MYRLPQLFSVPHRMGTLDSFVELSELRALRLQSELAGLTLARTAHDSSSPE